MWWKTEMKLDSTAEFIRLRKAGVPEGYATRMVLSHHNGGWMKCEGPPKCDACQRQVRKARRMTG